MGAFSNTNVISIDVKSLRTYQQLVLYFFPMVTNLGFVNIIVVVVRLWYFEKHMKQKCASMVAVRHTRKVTFS